MRRSPIPELSALAFLCFGLCTPARAELAAIWALDDGTKIKAGDLKHRLRGGNTVYSDSPPSLQLFGARNEIIAFQVILVGGEQKTAKVQVLLDSVGPIRNEGLSTDPDRYFIGRRIELFKQHYLNVTRRSRTRQSPYQLPSAAEEMTGWIPDALIPLPENSSLSVEARKNQGIWADIYIPRDTTPGVHQGTLQIMVEGKPCTLPACTIALELEVLPQTLPDDSYIKTMLWFSGSDNDLDCMPARYFKNPDNTSQAQREALRARHFKLARRHSVTMFLGADKEPTEPLRRRITGEAFSREAGYEGPGQERAQAIYSIHTYGGELNSAQAQMWSSWFKKHGPQVTYFLYTVDEPPPKDFPRVNDIARRARPVPSFTTASYQPDLDVDIYTSGTETFSVQAAEAARAKGKQVWIYNGWRPFSGSFMTDDSAVALRVNAWIQYKYHIPVWYYWEATYYKDFQGKRGQINVWKDPQTFSNRFGDKYIGDGLLMYPGRDMLFPEEDHGFDGPLPSIRLKNWRRGIQDVEYLVLAAKAGHEDFVNKLVQTLVPRALADETKADAPVSWPDDGEKWFKARRALATLLKTQKIPVMDTEALAAPPEPILSLVKRTIKRLLGWPSKKRLAALGGAGVIALFGVFFIWRRMRRG